MNNNKKKGEEKKKSDKLPERVSWKRHNRIKKRRKRLTSTRRQARERMRPTKSKQTGLFPEQRDNNTGVPIEGSQSQFPRILKMKQNLRDLENLEKSSSKL